MGLLVGFLVASTFISIEAFSRRFSLRGLSSATLGLGLGLFCAWLLTRIPLTSLIAAVILPYYANVQGMDQASILQEGQALVTAIQIGLDVIIYSGLGYIGAILSLRSNPDEFAFIIPYVRFRHQGSSGRSLVIDANVIIDGRLPSIYRSGFLPRKLVVPHFVLNELNRRANSTNLNEANVGRKGLDCLETMQAASDIEITIQEIRGVENEDSINSQIIKAALLLDARIMTTDDNLTKVARLQNISTLNLENLHQAMKTSISTGSRLQVELVRTGKEEHQAVGYLSDGSMVVVNHAVEQIGQTISVFVISTLQTTSGTIIFSEPQDALATL